MANRFLYGLDEHPPPRKLRVGMAQVDAAGIVQNCDEDFIALVHFERQALVGHALSNLDAALASEDEGRFRIQDKELHFKRLPASDKALPSTVCIQEVDRSRDSEEALRGALEAFEQLVDASPVGIVVLDKNKVVVLWNKAAEDIFGWTAEEIIGELYPLVPEDERIEFSKLFESVMAGEGYRHIESTRRRKDDSVVALRMSTTPIRDGNGEVVAALALLSDLSQQRLLEEKLSERVRLEAIGQLASGVAHDFNNMLTVVSAHCGFVLNRGKLSTTDKESLEAIDRCVQQASDLTSQLLTFGRKQIVNPTNLDLNEATRETVGVVTKVLGPMVHVEMELAPGLPTCRIDTTQFSQLLVNLLTNARDAMSGAGTISVATRLAELAGKPALLLSVTDTGKGIAPAELARVFEPFFTSKKPGEGTGLGLSTAFGIAEQAGGRLEVQSQEGLGSTFTLALPVAEELEDLETQRPATAPMDGQLSVLLVDDNDLVRETLAELMRIEGHSVTPVASGNEALTILEGERFDLMLTDVYMPGMDGVELASQAESQHPDLPILFMSGNLADPALRDRIEEGLASIIQKPIYPDELERALVEVVSGRVYRWS